jgi:hypothetical protein
MLKSQNVVWEFFASGSRNSTMVYNYILCLLVVFSSTSSRHVVIGSNNHLQRGQVDDGASLEALVNNDPIKWANVLPCQSQSPKRDTQWNFEKDEPVIFVAYLLIWGVVIALTKCCTT